MLFKVNNSVIKNKVFIRNNIFFIHQLMEDNAFLSYEEFINKYNVEIDYLSYYSILRCIKTSSNFNELEITNYKFGSQPTFATIVKNKKRCSPHLSNNVRQKLCQQREKQMDTST